MNDVHKMKWAAIQRDARVEHLKKDPFVIIHLSPPRIADSSYCLDIAKRDCHTFNRHEVRCGRLPLYVVHDRSNKNVQRIENN